MKPIAVTTKSTARKFLDARNKIIQKKRAKIRDAREKLVQNTKSGGDARLRLQKKRKDFAANNSKALNRERAIAFHKKKQVHVAAVPKYPVKIPNLPAVPRGYVDYDNMELDEGN